MIKACIFDLDGVIVDTAKFHYLSWKRLTRKLGFDFSLEQNERLKGINRMSSLEIILEIGGLQMDDNEKRKLCYQKNEWYKELISGLSDDEMIPGVKDFLVYLKDKDYKIALGSASKNARTVLDALDLNVFFDAIVDGNDVSKSKPDPEVFLKGANLLECDPQSTIVFEDSQKGLEAAVSANFIPVGVGEPHLLPQADIHIPNFLDLSMDQLVRRINNIQPVR